MSARVYRSVIGLAVVSALAVLWPSTTLAGEDPVRVKVGKRLSWGGSISERCKEFGPLIKQQAAKFKLDAGLLMAISRIESGFNPGAKNGSGATGLMQVMPSTGRRLKCGNLMEPDKNVACAARLLRKLIDYYDGRIVFAVAGYARGLGHPNAARRAKRVPSTHYFETVLRERARYLRHGCKVPRRSKKR